MISHQESPNPNPMTEPQSPLRTPFRLTTRRASAVATIVLLAAVFVMPLQAVPTIGTATFASHGPMAAPHVAAVKIPGLGALSPSLSAQVQPHLNAPFLHPGNPASLKFHQPTLVQNPTTSRFPSSVSPSGAGPGSSASNFYLSNSDCSSWGAQFFIPFVGGSSITQIGNSNQTLLAAGGSENDLFNSTGDTTCNTFTINGYLLEYGYGQVYKSNDGGVTWTNSPITPAVAWNSTGSPTNGSFFTGNEYIAGAPNGTALVIGGFTPACVSIPAQITCGTSAGQLAPWGFAVARSTDSGVTWSNATQAVSDMALNQVNFAAGCAAVGLTPGIYTQDLPENPWVATNGSVAVAGWDVFHYKWDPVNCNVTETVNVQVIHSSNGGLTWSLPQNISNVVSESVSLAMGPTSTHTIYAVFSDFANVSATGQYTFAWEKSTDGGVTWSTEKDLTKYMINPTNSALAAYPDSFNAPQFPRLAVDNWTASPYSGNIYLVYQDNQTGAHIGQPAIAFVRSTNGGTTWSTPTYVTAPTGAMNYVMPTVAVGPDGTVWVNYYGILQSNGNYGVYGAYSTNGGANWSSQFQVTDSVSAPSNVIRDIGFYMDTAATSAGEVPLWSDCRNIDCTSSYDVQLFDANVHPVSVTTNSASTVNASISTWGSATTYALPATLAWDTGSSHTVSVPNILPYNATAVDEFSGYAGLSTSTSFQTTFTYNGVGTLQALYAPVPAAFVRGSITPIVAGTTLTLDNTPVPLVASGGANTFYVITAANGQAHYLNVTAPKYNPQNVLIPTSAGGTVYQNFTLVRQNGFITGTVAPISGTTVTVNGTDLAVPGTGILNDPVPWGAYWVNASATGYTSFSKYVTVNPGLATVVTINLTGGWINGTVLPVHTGLVVTIDGTPVSTTLAGTFSASVPGGLHTLVATEPGYNTSTISNIPVVAGQARIVNVTLTNRGWISGSVAPIAALKNLLLKVTNGTQGGPITYSTTNGAFNVSETGGLNWTVTATAPGYVTNTTVVEVTAGEGSTPVNFVMTPSTPVCTSNCGGGHNNSSSNGTGSSTSGLSTTDLLIIVAVIVLVAIVALALVMRGRKGGGDDMSAPAADQPTYESSSPSDLPKLQSDGSMGPGSPPQ